MVHRRLQKKIWGGLGFHLGGPGAGFGRGLEPLGASWAVFQALFFMLVSKILEWSSKVLLEASGLDLGWILIGLGRIFGS